jgi:hypothetical protein
MERRLYSLIECLETCPKDHTGEANELNKGNNNRRIASPSYRPKKCDHQCIDCFLVFCKVS